LNRKINPFCQNPKFLMKKKYKPSNVYCFIC
jgi:hypothetical protein